MRLHHLEATAFGPFAETVRVDFDALSDAGLFLLSGPTGAGKSSVLDAVCFALYGDVPGDRSDAKRFRCDHAPPDVPPRVVLELSIAGRRFRCSRSPAWQRPKKRGAGTTRQQASVLVEEREGDEWVAHTNRMDEAGHLLTRLLGMTMPQFCQVAMLPQGRFQAFLRAGSEERHALLQQLFGTRRFEEVERWLRDHAREQGRASAEHQRAVARLVSRALEVTSTDLPEEWDLDDLAGPAGDGTLPAWSAALLTEGRERAEQAARSGARSADDERLARTVLTEATALAERRRRHEEAATRWAALESDEPAHHVRRSALAAARRAAPVQALERVHRTAAARRDAAACAARAAEEAAFATAAPGADPDREADAARERMAHARALLPREEELVGLTTGLAEGSRRLGQLADRASRLETDLAELPDRVAEVERQRDDAHRAAQAAALLTDQVEELAGRLDAHERASAVARDHESAKADLAATVEACLGLKETWLDLREQRIHAMAGELAAGLAVGASCPVCGSCEHPHKAEPPSGGSLAEAERAARSRLDDAEVARTALADRVQELATRLAVLEARAGGQAADELTTQLADARAERDRQAQAAERATELEEAAARLGSRLEEARSGHAGVAGEQTTLEARQADRAEEHCRLAREVAALLDGGTRTLAERIDRDRRIADDCARAVEARAALERAEERLAEAADGLAAGVAEQGFGELEEALAAAATTDELAALESRVTEHEQAVAATRAVLADPDLTAAAEGEPPDLNALQARHEAARTAYAQAHAEAISTAAEATRLAELDVALIAAVAAWLPVRRAHQVAAELAALTAGTASDNQWRMRLSAYVLAWRLGQVVAAANERLGAMTDQRYTLEHTGHRGAGERRGGLSLLVCDEWSGETRDPATLSGGETFVVSLALALGLADVVAHEAGGVELDTLFVDEGFGTLDPDTLDDVMDTLDGLRDGGRVVGVVSHVAELRTRIPVQLAVAKHRSGSTLRIQRSEDLDQR